MLVGNGGSTHLKAALGKLELLGNGSLFRAHGGKTVLGRQNIEVGPGEPQKGLLAGVFKRGLRGAQACLGLTNSRIGFKVK